MVKTSPEQQTKNDEKAWLKNLKEVSNKVSCVDEKNLVFPETTTVNIDMDDNVLAFFQKKEPPILAEKEKVPCCEGPLGIQDIDVNIGINFRGPNLDTLKIDLELSHPCGLYGYNYDVVVYDVTASGLDYIGESSGTVRRINAKTHRNTLTILAVPPAMGIMGNGLIQTDTFAGKIIKARVRALTICPDGPFTRVTKRSIVL